MAVNRIYTFGLFALVLTLLLDVVGAHSRRNGFGRRSRKFGVTSRHRFQMDSSISSMGSGRFSGMGGMTRPIPEPLIIAEPMAETNTMFAPIPEPEQGMAMGPLQGPGLGGMIGHGQMGPRRGIPTGSCAYCPADSRCVHGVTGPTCIPYGSVSGVTHGGINVCAMFKDPGYCPAARYIRYFYNAEHRHCERFNWSGCGGNKNRFASLRSCQYHCMKSVHMRHRHMG
ncbi:uncharacterized protein LOC121372438 [Gigantopelta aegis]|uniref:uncharacterized protein LOC121372438 n=1 Tax=Gigantopelta aegis TaxID=1735272 RepID=UPI001B88CB13|nr:uncharacterized protein LOC121372438 [Gigantopelta aegis]